MLRRGSSESCAQPFLKAPPLPVRVIFEDALLSLLRGLLSVSKLHFSLVSMLSPPSPVGVSFIRVASRDLGSRGLTGRAGCNGCSVCLPDCLYGGVLRVFGKPAKLS